MPDESCRLLLFVKIINDFDIPTTATITRDRLMSHAGRFEILFLLIFAWPPTVFSQPAEKGITYRGTVLDSDGKPAVGAEVFCTANFRSTTDQNGRFAVSIESDTPGNYRSLIAVSPDRKRLGHATPEFKEGDPAVPETVIELKSDIREIYGTVTDADGRPVEDALVGVGSPFVFPVLTKTDASGRYRLPHFVDLFHLKVVFARKPGYGVAFRHTGERWPQDALARGESLADRKNGPFDLRLGPARSATIKVIDESGSPIVGARARVYSIKVRQTGPPSIDPHTGKPRARYDQVFDPGRGLDDWTVYTDRQGLARFDWLPTDIPEIEGGPPGMIVSEVQFSASGGKGKYLKETDPPFGFELITWKAEDGRPLDDPPLIVLAPQAEVSGSVKLRDGTPVSWARIGRYLYADAKGEYRYYVQAEKRESRHMPGTPLTRYPLQSVCVDSSLGAAPCVFRVLLTSSEPRRVDFVLDRGVRVTGFVHDEDGKPVTDLRVDITEFNPNGLPNFGGDAAECRYALAADAGKPGRFECLLPPGKFRFYARKWFPDLESESIELIVKETDEMLSIDMPMKAKSR